MSSMTIAIGLCIITVICLGIIFMMPDEKSMAQKRKQEKAERRRERKQEQQTSHKDWEKTARRYQSQLHQVKNELESHAQQIRELQKQLLAEQVKTEKIKEKYNKVKEWIAKKESDVGKKEKGMTDIKQELKKVQDLYSDEHVKNIHLQKQLDELKKEHELTVEQRRLAENESATLKAKNDIHRQEIAHLKKDIAILTKKKNDETFVARSEFLKLEKELKEKNKEIERLNRQKES